MAKRVPLKRIKNRKKVVSVFERLDKKLRRKSAEYAAIADYFDEKMGTAKMT
jgi:hypothetical protein